MRLCSVSIDVDPIPCYYRIHGLGDPPPELRDLIFRRCVPRFADLLDSRGIRGTFFIVAEDLDVDVLGGDARAARAVIGELAERGHEIASHSYSHPYNMARLSRAAVRDELRRAHDLISDASGQQVVGFRAPGYDLSVAMLEELIELGYQYDSSMFPAPGYYAAKAAVMAGLRAIGRKSGAVMTNPRALLAPPDPYRPSVRAPWRRGDAPLIELPIAVTPISRVPAIGTSLLLSPEILRNHWIDAMRRRPLFNFELHGIDLADADADGIPGELVARQPDLRVSLSRKLLAMEQSLDRIAQTFEFAPLREVAEQFERDPI